MTVFATYRQSAGETNADHNIDSHFSHESKRREKSHTVQFLIKVFQIVHGYFLSTCVVHCAGGWSVKMMTSKNADDSKQKQKKASALLFEIQRIFVHPWVPAWTPLHVLSSLLMCRQCFILLEPECTGANGFAIFCYWPGSTVKSKKLHSFRFSPSNIGDFGQQVCATDHSTLN